MYSIIITNGRTTAGLRPETKAEISRIIAGDSYMMSQYMKAMVASSYQSQAKILYYIWLLRQSHTEDMDGVLQIIDTKAEGFSISSMQDCWSLFLGRRNS